MLKIDVQASAITNLTDARYFSAREAKYLCFDLSDGSVTLQAVAAIKEWVDGVEIVGAFTAEQVDEIRTIAEDLSLDVIQLGAFHNIHDVDVLEEFKIAKQIIVEPNIDWHNLASELDDLALKVHHFLLDFHKSNIAWSDLTIEQTSLLKSWCQQYPIILNISFLPSQLPELIALAPHAIDLKGGEEEKVGYKSFDELDDILDLLMIEE
ncbi:MAG: N-(5'-phosphoribosyl)anthranilate isomerase [Bacteroidota bacterium]